MRRGVWFAAGAGAGLYISFRARRIGEAFTSDGISDRIAALQLGGRLLREDIATEAAHKEAELRERIADSHDRAAALRAAATSQAPALPAAPDKSQQKESR